MIESCILHHLYIYKYIYIIILLLFQWSVIDALSARSRCLDTNWRSTQKLSPPQDTVDQADGRRDPKPAIKGSSSGDQRTRNGAKRYWIWIWWILWEYICIFASVHTIAIDYMHPRNRNMVLVSVRSGQAAWNGNLAQKFALPSWQVAIQRLGEKWNRILICTHGNQVEEWRGCANTFQD